jgi:formylglycine-generating enzyme
VSVATYQTYLAATGQRPQHVLEIWDGRWMPGPTFEEANAHGDDRAVVGVSHDDALLFTRWLGERCGARVRLPREAEFEYAARAGCDCAEPVCTASVAARPLPARAPRDATGLRLCPWPLRAGPPNRFGIRDLHGLIWQWCADWYAPYDAAPVLEDPCGPREAPEKTLWNGVPHEAGRVIRGGSFSYPSGFAACGHRHFSMPRDRNVNLGFRVAVPDGPQV